MKRDPRKKFMSGPDALHAIIDFSASHGGLRPIRAAFGAPVTELSASHAFEVPGVLEQVDAWARDGFWCVGYLRYEAAAAFEPRAALHAPDGPLAYFSVHKKPLDVPDCSADLRQPLRWQQQLPRNVFNADMERIHHAIADGEVYQVNYTSRLMAEYGGDPFALYCALRRAQPCSNAAYIANDSESVLSVSPELFFDWRNGELRCAPMKGTAARGSSPEQDRQRAAALRSSAKERAENVMIVDLIRNDLSRVATTGSVQVSSLFDCEAWPTVWQMTSQVVAQARPGMGLRDIFGALFPCGSVTGAPKLRAMHWIKELEQTPRGVYCGAVGVVQPGGAARFNVPIRTVVLRDRQAICGIGSGITADASAEAEWSEWAHKSLFLQHASEPFRLLQTLRRQDGRWLNLELHLDRLEAASAQFGFAFHRQAVREAVEAAGRGSALATCRGRLLIGPGGDPQVDVSELPATPPGILPVKLATQPVTAPQAFLRHKTTRRDHFRPFEADTPEAFDTLLWNEQGEVTEFTRGNVIVETADGQRVTPPLHCGLLDGVGRAVELASGRVQERAVRVEELASARGIWFVNALRGVLPVRLPACPR
jgi:para-aminobenzoate synthetase / 4-amino-4-deoxychorismate lyase